MKELDEALARRGLSPINQRKLWARTIIIKRIFIKRGYITAAEWDAEEAALIRDIESKMLENLRKELGLDGEE